MICRLCLKDIAEVIKIFDEIGVELSVAEILNKFFWFNPKRDDPISTAICNSCWIKVSNFNEFYVEVEEAHRLLNERFSIKTEERRGRRKCNSPNAADTAIIASKQEPADELDEELQFLLDPNVEQEGIAAHNETAELRNSISDEQHYSEHYSDNEEESFDGEMFMESILDTTENLEKNDNKDRDEIKHEPVKKEEVRRSTRSNVLALKTYKIGYSEKQKKNVSNTAESKFQSPPKKRSGRPRKLDNTIKEMIEVNDSIAYESKSPKHKKSHTDSDSPNSSSESKVQQVDEQIAKYMQLSCDVCAIKHSTFAQLRRHIEKIHNCKGYAVCCNKKFYKRALLTDHIQKHIDPECYKCNECDKVFADKQCMRNHILLKHQPEEVKTFECEHCPKKFAKSYLRDQHRVVHEARTHICDICQKGFPSSSLLGTHIKIIHGNYGTMCDICAKVIRGRAAFAKHQLEHAGVTIPKVQCDKCGSWHKDKYSLQKHKRRHNEEGTLYVCNLCGKKAPNRSALLSHHRYVHAAERTFECGVCKKAFKKAINLKEHMAMHTGEVLYRCPYCPKTFNSNANMHSHRKKMHPKEFEEARKSRRENSAKTQQRVEDIGAAEEDISASEMIYIKGTDNCVLVTTEDDYDQQINQQPDNSIIYSLEITDS